MKLKQQFANQSKRDFKGLPASPQTLQKINKKRKKMWQKNADLCKQKTSRNILLLI